MTPTTDKTETPKPVRSSERVRRRFYAKVLARNLELMRANNSLGHLNVELLMQRSELIGCLHIACNVKPSGLGDWKRETLRFLKRLKDPCAESPNDRAEPRPGEQRKIMSGEIKPPPTRSVETEQDKGRCAPASCSAICDVNWHPAVMEIVVWYDTQPVRRQNVIWPLLYEMNNQLHRLDRGDLDSPNVKLTDAGNE